MCTDVIKTFLMLSFFLSFRYCVRALSRLVFDWSDVCRPSLSEEAEENGEGGEEKDAGREGEEGDAGGESAGGESAGGEEEERRPSEIVPSDLETMASVLMRGQGRANILNMLLLHLNASCGVSSSDGGEGGEEAPSKVKLADVRCESSPELNLLHYILTEERDGSTTATTTTAATRCVLSDGIQVLSRLLASMCSRVTEESAGGSGGEGGEASIHPMLLDNMNKVSKIYFLFFSSFFCYFFHPGLHSLFFSLLIFFIFFFFLPSAPMC